MFSEILSLCVCVLPCHICRTFAQVKKHQNISKHIKTSYRSRSTSSARATSTVAPSANSRPKACGTAAGSRYSRYSNCPCCASLASVNSSSDRSPHKASPSTLNLRSPDLERLISSDLVILYHHQPLLAMITHQTSQQFSREHTILHSIYFFSLREACNACTTQRRLAPSKTSPGFKSWPG